MSVNKKNRGLGKGLDALYGDDSLDDIWDDVKEGTARFAELSIDQLVPDPSQPRRHMAEEPLNELALSIKEQGIINPIVVRELDSGKYEIIAGERRYQAAKIAGLDKVPTIVRDVDNFQALALALIENIQREDLNPLEESMGIERLIDEYGYTHEQVAIALGRSRTTVTNLHRLLSLTAEVKTMLFEKKLEMGHARALLSLEGADQVLLAKEIVAKGLSVRQTEDAVRKMKDSKEEKAPKKRVIIKTRDDIILEEALADTLGAVVKLTANQKGKGRIVIEFGNLEQLQGIVDHIQAQK